MKIAGLIGGVGPESTVDYYRRIIAAYQSAKSDGSYPPLFINCIDVNNVLTWAAEQQFDLLTKYLAEAIEQLARAGAHFAAITANTPHIVFDEVAKQAPIPMISIVETACAEAHSRGLHRLGILGTRSTMLGEFYTRVFSNQGMVLVPPTGTDLDYVHDVYTTEMVKGIFRPETRERLLMGIDRFKRGAALDAIVLAGTELPLLLGDDPASTIPLLNTTEIHVKEIVRQLLS
jgi:aspartate racemase